MKTLLNKIIFIFKDQVLAKRVLFIFFIFLIYRMLAAIPISVIDGSALKQFFETNQFFGFVNLFSGGGLSSLSIVMLGVMPYITASIIMQVMTLVVPKLKEMQQEGGDAGRKKIANISRYLSLPIAAVQSIGFLALLQQGGALGHITTADKAFALLIAVAGTVLLMWLGELITEFGIGNGLSLIIFAGIVVSLPGTVTQIYQTFDMSNLAMYIGVFVIFVLMVYSIVYVTEAERPVVVHHAKASRAGQKAQKIASTIPIKLNQAGVIPIIFAVSLITFPSMIFSFLQTVSGAAAGGWLEKAANFSQDPWAYGIVYFFLVFFFTYFYTAVTFDPKRMAENLAKSGTYVPGVRPGEDTEKYLGDITTRVTFFGGLFLAVIAILPIVIAQITGNQSLSVGGTSILIVVSVAIDLIRKINAQISVREYVHSV
ncbi:preprotein translocase subunit SecY [Candidatus Campbellbacteria bacterium]|nr:MAG: preprotein translocase subunit SecY [Candidatus Campbellbacteria bacterium]